MKISWNYLQSFFAKPLNKNLVLERLTMAGLEVEDESAVAPQFTGVVVAEVVSCERHPDADKLSLCQVNTGDEVVQIVCGAANVATGVKVPCATVGAVLPGDFKITPRKMRGILSHGMLCSGDELGCPDGVDGLLLLPAAAPVGADIRDYLGLDDIVVEFKITPNRGDCLSYAGLVREIAALTAAELKPQPVVNSAVVNNSLACSLTVAASAACPHYAGLAIEGVNNAAITPRWLSDVLIRSGIRPISPLVDITAYVMLLQGQPMHAFDLIKIAGGIGVRMAKSGDQLRLIDGKDVMVATDTLVITDAKDQPVALAGVMGGLDSSVTSDTKAVFLESAFFTPAVIHGKAKQYGVSSDAAFRYERGVDPQIQHDALNLAAKLIVEICGGTIVSTVHFSALSEQINSPKIALEFSEINRFIGEDISSAQVLSILQALGCGVEHDGGSLTVTVPSYRFDLAIKEDIIEEIVRVYGYDRVVPRMPQLTAQFNRQNHKLSLSAQCKNLLVGYGFNEIVSYAFLEDKFAALSPAALSPVKLQNPIAGLTTMRTSLIPGLLRACQYNVNRGQNSLKLFELARVFHGEEANQQPLYLSGLIYGKIQTLNWNDKVRDADFYDLSLVVNQLLAGCGEVILLPHSEYELFHPGRCARIQLAGQEIGIIGQLHPRLVSELDFVTMPYVFELNFDLLPPTTMTTVKASSKFQKVSRDMAFILPQTVAVGEVLRQLTALELPELRETRVFDVFVGGSLAADEKSVAFNFIFQGDKTLEDDEINAKMSLIEQTVIKEFAGRLR